jgi:hypothetical protein
MAFPPCRHCGPERVGKCLHGARSAADLGRSFAQFVERGGAVRGGVAHLVGGALEAHERGIKLHKAGIKAVSHTLEFHTCARELALGGVDKPAHAAAQRLHLAVGVGGERAHLGKGCVQAGGQAFHLRIREQGFEGANGVVGALHEGLDIDLADTLQNGFELRGRGRNLLRAGVVINVPRLRLREKIEVDVQKPREHALHAQLRPEPTLDQRCQRSRTRKLALHAQIRDIHGDEYRRDELLVRLVIAQRDLAHITDLHAAQGYGGAYVQALHGARENHHRTAQVLAAAKEIAAEERE